MKTSAFGELIFQPGDDFFADWSMHHGEDPDGEIARFIEHDDELGWGCEITDNNDRTAYAQDFASEADLRDWLTSARVKIED